MGLIEVLSCADRGAAGVTLDVLIAEAARGRGGPLYEGVDDEGASPDLGARFLCWVACCWKWVHSRFLVAQWTQRSEPGTRLHLTLRARQASHAVFCLRPSIALVGTEVQRAESATCGHKAVMFASRDVTPRTGRVTRAASLQFSHCVSSSVLLPTTNSLRTVTLTSPPTHRSHGPGRNR